MTQYFKVISHDYIHYDHTYKLGLNILNKQFDETGSCATGGLYFTDLDNIWKFFDYGDNLAIVELPVTDPDFKMVRDPAGDKYRANRIIIREIYSLYDLETYKKFELDIIKNYYIVDFASRYNNLSFLEWFKNSKLELNYGYDGIDTASWNGHVDVLEW